MTPLPRDEPPTPFEVPPELRRGRRPVRETAEAIRTGLMLLDLMRQRCGLTDLSQTAILDYGCGTRFTQAIISSGLPVRRYVGIDVYKPMIDWLREHVRQPQFAFHHVDAHNKKYNRAGEKLTPETALPIGRETFDLVCLFSVLTHVEPTDFYSILHILRRHVEADGKLFFSCFLDHTIPGDFLDRQRRGPLTRALYREPFVRKLVAEAGWRPISLHPPQPHIAHHFTCVPA